MSPLIRAVRFKTPSAPACSPGRIRRRRKTADNKIVVQVQTGHYFEYFLRSPFRHRQTSSGSVSAPGSSSVAVVTDLAPALRSRARCIFISSANLDQPTHLRLAERRLTRFPFAARKCRFNSSDRRARTSSSATTPESGPEFTGADSNASRTHSARRIPAPRARSSSKANSASLTFVPTDFVHDGGFIAHRVVWILDGLSELDAGAGRTLPVRCSTSGSGAGGGLRVCNS